MTFPDGTIKEGKFENNIFVGNEGAGSNYQSSADLNGESPEGGS